MIKTIENKIEENLQKFCLIENVDREMIPVIPGVQYSESNFLKNTCRNSTDSLFAIMPLIEDPIALGNSKVIAEERLNQL